MRKNKFFIKRKNTYSDSIERTIIRSVGSVILAVSTLASCWLLICLLNVLNKF